MIHPTPPAILKPEPTHAEIIAVHPKLSSTIYVDAPAAARHGIRTIVIYYADRQAYTIQLYPEPTAPRPAAAPKR